MLNREERATVIVRPAERPHDYWPVQPPLMATALPLKLLHHLIDSEATVGSCTTSPRIIQRSTTSPQKCLTSSSNCASIATCFDQRGFIGCSFPLRLSQMEKQHRI